VAGARRQDEEVSPSDLEAAAARATQHDRGLTADDAERLVGDRVEVVEREDPVPPLRLPAVGGEQLLARLGVTRGLDLVVDQDRQR
jgi:hypothetical protein